MISVTLGLLVGCQCQPPLHPVDPPRVEATPLHLVLPPAFPGQQSSGVFELSNTGGAPATVAISVPPPFSTDLTSLELGRGQTASLTVFFTPERAGHAEATLTLGGLERGVEADGLALPACLASGACVASRFDAASGQCLESVLPEGTGCQTRCVQGACAAGTCVGQPVSCDDGDACTVDACNEADGCLHAARVCPAPAGHCQVARCDSASGCGSEVAPDGTLCGPDDCAGTTVDVCIAGQCVSRVRPQTGRCTNLWKPTSMPARSAQVMAWDPLHRRVVLFGGSDGISSFTLGQTWEWDGARWTQRFPAASPQGVHGAAMAWDAVRQRLVLFGGLSQGGSASYLSADTWEWDGTTWLMRQPTSSPPALMGHAMAWDVVSQRVLLFGGRNYGSPFAETWAWDGMNWVKLQPAVSPPALVGHAMAWDPLHRKVLLFGGEAPGGAASVDTWEWDGASWLLRNPVVSPPGRSEHSLAFDESRQRVVLSAGRNTTSPLGDTWEWDGVSWAQPLSSASPVARTGQTLAWDGVQHRVLLFGGLDGITPDRHPLGDTWAWDGQRWQAVGPTPLPPGRTGHAVAYDRFRQRFVLFGGKGIAALADTWEWDGAAWQLRVPATSPPPRFFHTMVWDELRRRVVLFGGDDAAGLPLADTWSWDGTSWLLASSATSPPAGTWPMTWDSVHQRVVLVTTQETWEWDGSSWSQRAPFPSPSPSWVGALAWDGARQQVLWYGMDSLFYSQMQSWEWDGVAWLQQPVLSPAVRFIEGMAWDTDRRRVVLFGGGESFFGNYGPETWEWDGTAWWQRAPTTSPPVYFPGGTGLLDWMAYDEARRRMTLFDGVNLWQLLP